MQKRVVAGLPSVADEGTGDNATGAHDIVVSGKHVTGLIGRRQPGAARVALGPASDLFGWVVKIDPWKGTVKPFADVAAVRGRQQPGRLGESSTRTPTA